MSFNQDLQASHKIITLLENSVSNAESILDRLPGIFLVINSQGEILRGNTSLAKHLGLDDESLLRKSLSLLFNDKTWSIFKSNIDKLFSDLKSDSIQFELSIKSNTPGQFEKPHLWFVSKVKSSFDSLEGQLFSVVGEDVSELREQEKNLLEIFASIPLGIMAIGENGVIESNYSRYLELILEGEDYGGKSIFDVLFAPSKEFMTESEKDGVKNMISSLGQEEIVFDLLKSTYPCEMFFPIAGNVAGGRWLRLTYNPIVYNGMISRMLVIVEDRSELVKAEKERENAKLLEDQSISRIVQLKVADEEVLDLVVVEIPEILEKVTKMLKEDKTGVEIATVIHGLKGNARVVGFETLTELSHDFESFLLEDKDRLHQLDLDKCDKYWKEICAEWNEIYSIYRTLFNKDVMKKTAIENKLFDRYNSVLNTSESFFKVVDLERILLSLNASRFATVASLKTLVQSTAEVTSKSLGKKIIVESHFSDIVLDKKSLSSIQECLLHVVNNAIDHGIETPEQREALGKNIDGRLVLSVRESEGKIYCQLDDDGRGIDPNIIREEAKKRKVIPLIELLDASDDKLLQLIFHPGFSTADVVSDLSGRGIGMNAIKESMDEIQGNVFVKSLVNKGTALIFEVNPWQQFNIQRSCRSTVSFIKVVCDMIDHMKQYYSIEIEKGDDLENKGAHNGVAYLDPLKILVTISSYVGHVSASHVCNVNLIVDDEGHFVLTIKKLREQHNSNIIPNEFSKTLDVCRYFLLKHNGSVQENDSEIILTFGHQLSKEYMPMLTIGIHSSISADVAADTVLRLKEIVEELNMKVVFVDDDLATILISESSFKETNCLSLGANKKVLTKELLTSLEVFLGG